MELSSDIIVPVMVFAIPLAAIIGNYVIKFRKLELENQNRNAGMDQETTRELLAELKRLRTQNGDIVQRLDRLEANQLGASAGDEDLLQQQRNLERN